MKMKKNMRGEDEEKQKIIGVWWFTVTYNGSTI